MKNRETLDRLISAFKEVTQDIFYKDLYTLPTYIHIDKIPYLITNNTKNIKVTNIDKQTKILINEYFTKEDIVSLIYKNFINL